MNLFWPAEIPQILEIRTVVCAHIPWRQRAAKLEWYSFIRGKNVGRMPPLEHVQKMQYKYLMSVEVSVRVWRFMKGLNSMFVECALMCLSL